MLMQIRDDVIWAKHLKASPEIYEAIVRMADDEIIRLCVDGIVGDWARMRAGKDGRPTAGIKPVGAMSAVWKRMQERRGELVQIVLPGSETDPWLKLADRSFSEWMTAEDEEAFGQLEPL